MKKIIVVFSIVLMGLYSGSDVYSQVTKAGTTSGQFLKIGLGARATAMGDASVAVVNDVNAIYWNPAGLSHLTRNEVTLQHIEWLADISYDFVGMGVPLGPNVGSFALFAMSLGIPDDKVRTVFEPEGTGEFFSASSVALGISYSRFLTDRFSVGINAKYIHERIWSMAASAVAVDIGTFFRSKYRNLKIAVCLSNFGTKMQYQGRANLLFVDPDVTIEGNNDRIRAALEMDKWDLPLIFRVGFSIDPIESEHHRLTLAMDAVHPSDNREYINSGVEYGLYNVLFLRGGFRGLGISAAEGGVTLGSGLQYTILGNVTLKLDYAYADYNRLGSIHRYSLSVVF